MYHLLPEELAHNSEEDGMSSDQLTQEDEMARAADLPQADASSLVDREVLVSERALDACSTYGVESISLAAVRQTSRQ